MALAQTRPSGAQTLLLGGRLGGGGRGRRFPRSGGALGGVGLGRAPAAGAAGAAPGAAAAAAAAGAAVVSSTITVGGTIVTTVWSALERPAGSPPAA